MATKDNQQPQVDEFAIATSGEQKQKRLLQIDRGKRMDPRSSYDARSASTDQGYEHLAADIVAGAIREFLKNGSREAERYLRSHWCKNHCYLVGVNHDVVLDKIEGRI